jgi:hypothetical protein
VAKKRKASFLVTCFALVGAQLNSRLVGVTPHMMEGGKRQWASMPRVSYTRKFAPPTEENGTGATPDDEKKPDTNSKNTNTSNTAPVVDHVAQKNEEKKQDRKDSTNGEQTKRALVNLTKSQPASSGSSNNSDDQPSKILSRHNDDKLSTLISEVANLRQSIDAVSKQVTRLQSEQSTSKDILALLEKNLTRNELATKIEDVRFVLSFLVSSFVKLLVLFCDVKSCLSIMMPFYPINSGILGR